MEQKRRRKPQKLYKLLHEQFPDYSRDAIRQRMRRGDLVILTAAEVIMKQLQKQKAKAEKLKKLLN